MGLVGFGGSVERDESGVLQGRLLGELSGGAHAVAWDPSLRYAYSSGEDQRILRWDRERPDSDPLQLARGLPARSLVSFELAQATYLVGHDSQRFWSYRLATDETGAVSLLDHRVLEGTGDFQLAFDPTRQRIVAWDEYVTRLITARLGAIDKETYGYSIPTGHFEGRCFVGPSGLVVGTAGFERYVESTFQWRGELPPDWLAAGISPGLDAPVVCLSESEGWLAWQAEAGEWQAADPSWNVTCVVKGREPIAIAGGRCASASVGGTVRFSPLPGDPDEFRSLTAADRIERLGHRGRPRGLATDKTGVSALAIGVRHAALFRRSGTRRLFEQFQSAACSRDGAHNVLGSRWDETFSLVDSGEWVKEEGLHPVHCGWSEEAGGFVVVASPADREGLYLAVPNPASGSMVLADILAPAADTVEMSPSGDRFVTNKGAYGPIPPDGHSRNLRSLGVTSIRNVVTAEGAILAVDPGGTTEIPQDPAQRQSTEVEPPPEVRTASWSPAVNSFAEIENGELITWTWEAKSFVRRVLGRCLPGLAVWSQDGSAVVVAHTNGQVRRYDVSGFLELEPYLVPALEEAQADQSSAVSPEAEDEAEDADLALARPSEPDIRTNPPTGALRDSAIITSDDDQLSRGDIARRLARAICDFGGLRPDRVDPYPDGLVTIGLVDGGWGRGKTSLTELIAEAVDGSTKDVHEGPDDHREHAHNQAWDIIRVNAWDRFVAGVDPGIAVSHAVFRGADRKVWWRRALSVIDLSSHLLGPSRMIAALLGICVVVAFRNTRIPILDALIPGTIWVGLAAFMITWWLAPLSFWLGPLSQKVEGLLTRADVSTSRRALRRLCESGRTLLIIDDLDRCRKEEARATLEFLEFVQVDTAHEGRNRGQRSLPAKARQGVRRVAAGVRRYFELEAASDADCTTGDWSLVVLVAADSSLLAEAFVSDVIDERRSFGFLERIFDFTIDLPRSTASERARLLGGVGAPPELRGPSTAIDPGGLGDSNAREDPVDLDRLRVGEAGEDAAPSTDDESVRPLDPSSAETLPASSVTRQQFEAEVNRRLSNSSVSARHYKRVVTTAYFAHLTAGQREDGLMLNWALASTLDPVWASRVRCGEADYLSDILDTDLVGEALKEAELLDFPVPRRDPPVAGSG